MSLSMSASIRLIQVRRAFDSGFVVLLADELDPPVASELLGVVHRDVGVHQHLVRRSLDIVEDGDADACAERDLFAGNGRGEGPDLLDEALRDGASRDPVAVVISTANSSPPSRASRSDSRNR